MEIIELERWKPSETNPHKLEYEGQPTAGEVFEELKGRLERMGYLPDEYFKLCTDWKKERQIPRDADIFCNVDYGASEGVYVDVYLKWYHEPLEKDISSRFIAGKSLGENGNDLDRMFLIASAITKAFHGDNVTHMQCTKSDFTEEDIDGCVVHLSQREQKVLIDALVEQRERQENAMSQTEQLLRRITGNITEYVNAVGMRPLRMSDYDKAVLAIQDGNLEAFKIYAAKASDPEDSLLVEAAGRPGAVGRKMTELLVANRMDISYESYHLACKKAIDIADSEKLFFLLEQAQTCVSQLEPAFYGKMADYASLDHHYLAHEIVRRQWNPSTSHPKNVQKLKDSQTEMEQARSPEMGGQTLG